MSRFMSATVFLLLTPAILAQDARPQRAPAVPLVTHSPYFSVWSMADRPTDDWSKHWTGTIQAMCGMVRVDGKAYRVLGPEPKAAEAMKMTNLEILPTRTIYTFEAGGVEVKLTFAEPKFPDDLDALTRPTTYLTYSARALDDNKHKVDAYFDATGEWAVNTPDQKVSSETIGGDLSMLKIRSTDQKVLGRSGDGLRIEWGEFVIASPGRVLLFSTSDKLARGGFVENREETIPTQTRTSQAVNDNWPVFGLVKPLGDVGKEPRSWHLILAYDEEYSLEYFKQKLRPYWKRSGKTAVAMLQEAESKYDATIKRCEEFDKALMAALEKIGGKDYARLCALSYRQCLSAHGYAALPDGKLLMLSKENFSNGCIGTVDVTYPAAPFFLLFNVEMLKAQVTPVLDYGKSDRWKFDFAPHDLGQYPLANGQVYGGGEKTDKDQMPVEECGNMLILVAAIAKADGNADYATPYWPLLTKWADYLKSKGLDPENQLCTDDFAGHLAHNTNLSLKAIVALGGYARMCEMLGKTEEAKVYRRSAEEMAKRWVEMAKDGDHYKLAFDKTSTWSQKYNLVWDKLLGLNLFPPDVARTEVAYYLKNQKEFGLPLDNRSLYTKLDWIVWTATMADTRADFEAFLAPLIRFAEKSPSRVPLTDWYWTQDAKQQGFQARSVVGGVFIKMLDGRKRWGQWNPVVEPR
jgi:Domain of unknown function (DUF4965)/Domain of unknown function (DUF5127)/Domain of unknown function (DUF1793)/Domain of unknown function (DUF4964)